MKRKLVVGLTGGIACGKTTVAGMFRGLGADVIDADSIGHQLLSGDSTIKGAVVAAFGRCILDDNGEIDRSKLGRIVFDNPDRLRKLNNLLHPPIIKRMESEIERRLSSSSGHKVIVIDAALLIELDLMYMVDLVVLVSADEDTQIRRLAQRGLSRDDALKRIKAQMPLEEKRRFADFIIHNDGALSDTVEQVKQVWEALMRMACAEGT